LTEKHQILRSTRVVTFVTLLSRLFGYARDLAIAVLLGTSFAADAFVIAFRIPNLLRRLMAEGAMTGAFIPVFTSYRVEHTEAESWDFARRMFWTLATVLAGVTLNPGTPLAGVEPVLGDADLVLVMSVNPGFGGQKFIPSALERVREARRMMDARGSKALLEVDGGVTAGNAPALREAGADVLVAGTAVFGSPDYAAAIRKIRGE